MVVGLANALLYNALGSRPWGPLSLELEFGPTFTAHMLSAVLAGLTVSGALLVFADRAGFERGSSPVAAICGGGAILGVFLHFSIVLIDEREPMPQGFEILFDVLFPAVSGGVLGIFEGAYLGIPLAWLLGVFGSRTAERAGAR